MAPFDGNDHSYWPLKWHAEVGLIAHFLFEGQMSVEQRRLYELLAPSIESVGCELLGVQISRGRQHTVLRLYIDRLQDEGDSDVVGSDFEDLGSLGSDAESAQGVTLDDCTRVSRQVSGVLDVEDPIEGEYSLEVSSPGDDRPLFRLEHYERFIGHLIRVRLVVPIDGRRSVTGHIVAIEDGKVIVEEGEVQWELSMEQISLARLVPPT